MKKKRAIPDSPISHFYYITADKSYISVLYRYFHFFIRAAISYAAHFLSARLFHTPRTFPGVTLTLDPWVALRLPTANFKRPYGAR